MTAPPTITTICCTLGVILLSAVTAAARPAKPALGLADPHVHITADLRAGGAVIYGRAFHPDGIEAALGGDAQARGPEKILDVTGGLLRDGLPLHDTDGWPAFDGWPTYDTTTHQQVYWTWLRRMWERAVRNRRR